MVRYFGGTKLGTSGLIAAYRGSAAEALGQATIIQKTIEAHFELHFHYGLMSDVMNALKRGQVPIEEQDFGEEAKVVIALPRSEAERRLLQLKASIAKISVEQAEQEPPVIGGFKVEDLGVY